MQNILSILILNNKYHASGIQFEVKERFTFTVDNNQRSDVTSESTLVSNQAHNHYDLKKTLDNSCFVITRN